MALSDVQKTAHMLRRFGLGASEAELDYYGSGTYEQAVDKFIKVSLEEPPQLLDPQDFANSQGVVNIRVMQGLWYARLCMSNQPLREKLTIFWHDHFAVGGNKVTSAFAMNQYVDVMRRLALGSFKELLTEVSRSPAMIYWLDGQDNVAGRAQENFGREVMELFTLGIGHYTEKDVQECARAFTGWSYLGASSRGASRPPGRQSTFAYRADQHDTGEKVLLGRRGKMTGSEVLDLLCDEPRTALYITEKLWKWFVSPTLSTATHNAIAQVFVKSKLSISALVKHMMLHPEFVSQAGKREIVKNPVDFCLATARALGVGTRMSTLLEAGKRNPQVNEQNGTNVALIRAVGPAFALLQATSSMGMELMEPPDVAGWQSGLDWITSATMTERIKWSENLWQGGQVRPRANLGGNAGGARGGATIGIDPRPIFGQARNPNQTVERLLSLFDAEASPMTKTAMVKAASDSDNIGSDSIRLATKILFASPEFQMM